MMVPYIKSPPTTDITIAGTWIAPLWARTAGSATWGIKYVSLIRHNLLQGKDTENGCAFGPN